VPEIIFIGTGDAFASGGRRNSSILLRDGSRTLLLDCGPTTLGGLKELGIDPREIDGIVVSHFHGDHSGGIPFFLLDAKYENPRTRPLVIVGPPGIEQRVKDMCSAFSYFCDEESEYEARFHELSTEGPIDVGGLAVHSYPAHHHPETSPHMVALESEQRRLFFTGDTGWHEALPERVGAASLLISECVYYEPVFEYHLSHVQLERYRDRFRCDRMILTHLGSQVLGDRDRMQFDTAEEGLRLEF
jgi:ribonuclease BN (tRNA processing enzyme)